MIIEKLNSVFRRHSRWLFGAFTIVIIVSFLGFLTPGTFGFGGMGDPESISMGTAYGKEVTYGELRSISRNLAVFSEVFNGMSLSRDMPNEAVFIYACMLRKADSFGLAVSDKEVAALIRRTPAFVKNGRFDRSAYDKMLQTIRRSGITEQDLYDACRQQIMLDKLQRELTSGIAATEGEAKELYRKLNTVYSVRVVEFPAADPAKLKASDKEIRKYFAAHRASYVIPGKVDALVIAWDARSFRGEAAKLASDKALKAFFDRNPKAFENDKIKSPKFEAAKSAVKEKFIEEASLELAQKAAYDFAATAYEQLGEQPAQNKEKLFRSLADRFKLVVIEAGSAEFGAAAIGKIKSAALVNGLAALVGDNRVTDPVVEGRQVYIGFARSRLQPRQAEYKEVSAKVKADCLAEKASSDAMKKAASAYAELSRTKPQGALKILAKYKGCRFSQFDFSLMTKRPPEDRLDVALAVVNLKTGAFTSPVPGKNGAVIAQLTGRAVPDMKAFDKQKDLYVMMCRNQKMSLAMQSLQEEFAANCRFTGSGRNN